MAPTRVAIIGASGYTGAELLRLLLRHPEVEISHVSAKRAAGQRVVDVFPHLRVDLTIEAFDAAEIAARAEVAFVCLPHGEAAPVVAELFAHGLVVLDLSADFRLRDPDEWARWYGHGAPHPAGELLARAVYGMPERHRAALRGAKLIACPGCYPTASILAIAPLVERGVVAQAGLVIDAKSGVSGAGRGPALAYHLPEAAEGIRPYKVGGAHRHTAEIEQELGAPVIFTPHLVPMSRGILACVYATPLSDTDPREVLAEAYANEPFVDVLPAGQLPDTAHVRGSNRIQVTAIHDARAKKVLAIAAIDNLVKGASGQAVQCMNLALGFAETTGLEQLALFP